jgi:sulfite reductase alpha subunit|tara:strand:+ start:1748 stop:2896 length:1149 start_codon:yes stop_codon:yes gene_type:complete
MGLKTPLIDELCKGPWPSHASELKKSNYTLLMYEEALKNKESQWRGGGYVAVPGVPSGVIARASKRPDILEESSVVRVFPPPGLFFNTDLFRKLIKIVDKYSRSLLHLSATTSDIELIEVPHNKIGEMVKELENIGMDVGSSDVTLRTVKGCIGPARCDVGVFDTIAFRQAFTNHFLDDMQYPRFPHKIKTKTAGCPNDCVYGAHKAEIHIIGTFKDAPKIDQEKLIKWVKNEGDINYICSRCPTSAMKWDGQKLKINNNVCIHCMYCINKCSAIRPGDERGASVLVGGKYRSKYGPTLAKVLVPFIVANPPEFKEIIKLIHKIVDVYDENSQPKERMGEFLYRIGFDKFMELVGVNATPQNFIKPRENLFHHWKKDELGVG